jgi:biotin carboxyl carrier protein
VKYFVTLEGREFQVDVDGERVTVKPPGPGRVRQYSATLTAIAGTPLRQLVLDGGPSDLVLDPGGPGVWAIAARGERWEVEVVDERTRHIRGLTGGAGAQRGTPPLKAPMPGLVLRILAEPGQAISAGAGVVVLEAMKMENELRAAAGSVVKTVRVKPGEAVEKGQVLVEFEVETT